MATTDCEYREAATITVSDSHLAAVAMALKKFDLEKNLGKKLEGHRKGAPVSGRYGDAAGDLPDRRARRKLDAAAGLVPFACKLPTDLVDLIRQRSMSHPAGLNAMLEEIIRNALAQSD